ncbi:adenylate kinase [soil metagenome]
MLLLLYDESVSVKHAVIVGPQGAGKGTQAEQVAPQLGLVHLATGDLFRALMVSGSDLAEEVSSYVDKGDLVPDELTAKVLFAALDDAAAAQSITGALFDGYPRNPAQAEVLDEKISERGEVLGAVIHITVPHDVLMERLTGRLVCRNCGRAFHKVFNPSSKEGVCDICGGELYQRSDDTPEAVERRLTIYFEQTEPLLERWRARGIVHDIDGNQPIEKVTDDIINSMASAVGLPAEEHAS